MTDQEQIDKFIQLRSQGVTFGSIADQLGVPKSTLVYWSRKHSDLIQNLRAIEWETCLHRALADKRQRLSALTEQLTRLDTEFAERDLSQVPPWQLQRMAERIRTRLDREYAPMTFTENVDVSPANDTRYMLREWQP